MDDKTNIRAKLRSIRIEFREQTVKKTGINTHAEFTYFELSDIVPVLLPILDEYECLFLVNFKDGYASGELVDDDGGSITFTLPYRPIAEPAKFRMNEAQAAGAEMTYFTRYLYYRLLEIGNADEIDGAKAEPVKDTSKNRSKPPVKAPVIEAAPAPAPAPAEVKKPSKAPATAQERKAIASEIVTVEKPDELMVNRLKAHIKVAVAVAGPDMEEMENQIVTMTRNYEDLNIEQSINILEQIDEILAECSVDPAQIDKEIGWEQ